MARWSPDAVGRLQQAAIELYRNPGYDQVTVAQLAERAGLTRRTFFRYFPDKKEVLFYGADIIEKLLLDAVAALTGALSPLEMAVEALMPIARASDEDPTRAGFVRQRHAAIQAHAELRERELSKSAAMAVTIASALVKRGVSKPDARLASEAALMAFRVGFEEWFDQPKKKSLEKQVKEAMKGFESVVTAKPRKMGLKRLEREKPVKASRARSMHQP